MFKKRGPKVINVDDSDEEIERTVVKPVFKRSKKKLAVKFDGDKRVEEEDEDVEINIIPKFTQRMKSNNIRRNNIEIDNFSENSDSEDGPRYTKDYLQSLKNNTKEEETIGIANLDINTIKPTGAGKILDLPSSNTPIQILSQKEIDEIKSLRRQKGLETVDYEDIKMNDEDEIELRNLNYDFDDNNDEMNNIDEMDDLMDIQSDHLDQWELEQMNRGNNKVMADLKLKPLPQLKKVRDLNVVTDAIRDNISVIENENAQMGDRATELDKSLAELSTIQIRIQSELNNA